MKELVPVSSTKITKKKAREIRLSNLLIQDERFTKSYRDVSIINKKRIWSLEEIAKKVRDRILDTNFLEGLSSEGIGVVSASKLRTYRGCHFAYLLSYALHLDPPLELPQMVNGENIHKVIEDFNLDRLRTADELINGRVQEYFENGKRKEKKILGFKARWYGSVNSKNIYFKSENEPHAIFKMGKKLLEAFFEREKNNPKPRFAERKFDNIILTADFQDKRVAYKVRGIFDKIDIIGKKIKITDYKTGDGSDVFSDFDLQLTLYWYAYNKLSELLPMYPKPANPEDLELAIYYLPIYSPDKIEERKTFRNEIDLKYLVNEIYNADVGIMNKNFSPYIGHHCKDKSCFWQELCYKLLYDDNKSLFNFIVSQYQR